jgi:hypothetical protein
MFYSLIAKDMLERVTKTNDKFVVVCFDLPSENINSKDEKLKKSLACKRITIGNSFYACGVRLNKSVYVIKTEKVNKLLSDVEKTYIGLPKEIVDIVDVKIVGKVFDEVIEKLLFDDINKLMADMKEQLELLDVDIRNNVSDKKSIFLKRAYKISSIERIVDSRITDLQEINDTIANKKRQEYQRVRTFKREIMRLI